MLSEDLYILEKEQEKGTNLSVCLVGARHCAGHFIYIILFNCHNAPT